MAVTRNGTIYLTDTGNNRVRAVSAAGTITTVAGGLAAGPGGIVVMNGQRIQRITRQGLHTLIDFSHVHPAGLRGFLPNGIAASPDGAIYLDTDAGNGYTARTALIEVQPGGRIQMLWQD